MESFYDLRVFIEKNISIKTYIIFIIVLSIFFKCLLHKDKIIFKFKYYRQRLKLKFGYRSFNKQWKREMKEAEKEGRKDEEIS